MFSTLLKRNRSFVFLCFIYITGGICKKNNGRSPSSLPYSVYSICCVKAIRFAKGAQKLENSLAKCEERGPAGDDVRVPKEPQQHSDDEDEQYSTFVEPL